MSRFWFFILCWLVLSVVCIAPNPAAARDEDLFIRSEDQRYVFFAGIDAGRSVFASGGAKQAITGSLDRPGWLALESTGFGLTRERVTLQGMPLSIQRFSHETSTLVGYQVMRGPIYVAAYIGPEIQHEQVAYDGQFGRFSKPRLGGRMQGEIWANPTPDTLLTANVVASSARESLWARAAAGLKVFDKAFLGPEVSIYATPSYREVRWGLHVTGPRIGIVSFRLSGGWMINDARRAPSPYLGLSAWIRL